MTKIEPAPIDFVRGDATGLRMPAHPEALRAGGEDFLTEAFRAFGSIAPDNRVARITRFEPCLGGSTGQKVFLSVEYERPGPGLHADLFVKFSRDFSDPLRDRGRYEMESEARFAAVSRMPGFPISVPAAYFADFHHADGTGLIITERVAFGDGAIEPHRQKSLDHDMADPLPYYRALVTALARLAAAHKAGRLPPDIEARFPFDAEAAAARNPIPHDEAQLRALVAGYADFAAKHPQLLPADIRTPEFIALLDREVGRFLRHEATIKRFLHSNPDLVALCHWNANIDNAWFWRDPSGELHCGLIDWGGVGQLNLVYAIFGCLFASASPVWDDHLEALLALFADEFAAHGGPRLEVAELVDHMQLYVAMIGLTTLLEYPPRILFRLPEAATAAGPLDPVFRKSEPARNQLHILTVFLKFWRTHDFSATLDRLLAQEGAA
jgi:hypothetical protein